MVKEKLCFRVYIIHVDGNCREMKYYLALRCVSLSYVNLRNRFCVQKQGLISLQFQWQHHFTESEMPEGRRVFFYKKQALVVFAAYGKSLIFSVFSWGNLAFFQIEIIDKEPRYFFGIFTRKLSVFLDQSSRNRNMIFSVFSRGNLAFSYTKIIQIEP